MGVQKHPETGEYCSQSEYLKAVGRYGSTRDPKYNRETGCHDCCGSKKYYYHKKDCPLCNDDDV